MSAVGKCQLPDLMWMQLPRVSWLILEHWRARAASKSACGRALGSDIQVIVEVVEGNISAGGLVGRNLLGRQAGVRRVVYGGHG